VQTYKTVVIGTQTWMAENLNYNAPGSKCHSDNEANCITYGKLYDWTTAMKVCPNGWHLSSNAEWTTLVDFVGGLSVAGIKLKAMSWNDGGNGTDDYGFSALPAGFGGSHNVGFYGLGQFGEWWTATENGDNLAYRWSIGIHGDKNLDRGDGIDKTSYYSVRCIKN